jgi:pilus assembly protein CpaE
MELEANFARRAGAPSHIDPLPRISIQAFCETAEMSALIGAAMHDRRMAKAQVKQNMGGAAAAVEAYRTAPTPNVIVLEAQGGSPAGLVERLDELAQSCDVGTKVVVLGRANDIALYRQLMARGVSEYLVAPFDVVDFVRAVSDLYRAPGAKPLGKIVAVVGAKGGVGASMIAHNLAWRISTFAEMATVIVDLDLAFGTAGLDFNQDPAQGVGEAVFAPDRLDAVLVDRLLSKCGENLSLLAAPAALDRVLDLNETSFDSLFDVLRAVAPWIILDVPHHWTGWVRRTLTMADQVVLVATPDLANLRNAKNMIDVLRNTRPHDSPPRLILNGVGASKRPEINAREFAKTLELEPIAVLPHDAKLFGSATNNGQMIAEVDGNGRIAKIFAEIATAIAGHVREDRRKKGLFDPLMAKLALGRG